MKPGICAGIIEARSSGKGQVCDTAAGRCVDCVGDPDCTGCDWRYIEMMPGPARLVEI